MVAAFVHECTPVRHDAGAWDRECDRPLLKRKEQAVQRMGRQVPAWGLFPVLGCGVMAGDVPPPLQMTMLHRLRASDSGL